ncbi:MAG TPA: HEAT repeat domain-containing protein [Gemmatales bacterium]|nr:HEAT repeat domain-containing protein [Gemmatales bacterium]
MNQAIYPDHSRSFVRYSLIATGAIIVMAILGVGYLIWKDSVHNKYQAYVNNVKESIDLHQTAITHVKKALDPLEGIEAQKTFRESKGKIDFLAVQRKRLPVPVENDESLRTLLNDLDKAEKELAQTQEDIKKLSTQLVKPQADQPDRPIPNFSSSITSGPPATTPKTAAQPRKSTDENSVIISIPGFSREQWNDEFSKRFAMLADGGQGQVTVKWSGDLLTLEVRPVLDPARYATKINFGRLLYYSRNDRNLTIEFNPERVNNYAAQGDLITPILLDLKQRDKIPKLHTALTNLTNLKVDPARQAEVATVLETVATDTKLDPTMRDMAIKLIPAWSGKESANLLIRLMDDKAGSVRLTAIDALVETRSPLAAAALVKKWEKAESSRISDGLIALGSDVEPVVLPYLNNTTNLNVRVEACRVLQHIGTAESLKPLLDLMNMKDQSPALINAAKEAMKQILDRKTK